MHIATKGVIGRVVIAAIVRQRTGCLPYFRDDRTARGALIDMWLVRVDHECRLSRSVMPGHDTAK